MKKVQLSITKMLLTISDILNPNDYECWYPKLILDSVVNNSTARRVIFSSKDFLLSYSCATKICGSPDSNSNNVISLNCIILGDNFDDIFTLEISCICLDNGIFLLEDSEYNDTFRFRMMCLDKFQPFIIITFWDSWGLLWTFSFQLSKEMKLEEQMEYITRSLERLAEKSRIATLIKYEVLDSDPRELIYYINCVAEFGFNHIIIVGETEYGMIFIDCYGRVFMWDDESPMLWPLGNSPEEVPKQTIKGKMC
ncbi:hypothetical protein RhiirC2_863086 [Rhizophagus irregularis]|uniref:Uncharacterized protein n=1 Tax=Rhizophagus irregularis TaxID=588596 RepID=A0A2N1NP88_9GLOM|nr:hypothetical protein RhiirC2_863086 [Rhizophagus irregularis]